MEARKILVSEIEVDPDQPREIYSNMESLVGSIKTNGFQPQMAITVQSIADSQNGKKYRTIIGNRRTMASEKAGILEIWAFVSDGMSDAEIYGLQIMENENRENLLPMERARAIRKGIDRGISMNRLAKVFTVTLPTLKADLELCGLAPELHKFVDTGKLPKEVARKLATELVEFPKQMHAFNSAVRDVRSATKMLAALQAYMDKRAQTDIFAQASRDAADNGGLMKARKSSEKLQKAVDNFMKTQTEVGAENMVNARKRESKQLRSFYEQLKKIAEGQISTLDAFDARTNINAPKEAVAV